MNLQHRAAVLARTDLFQGIDEETQRRIAAHVAERFVERGQCVFVQDEPGDRMYVLAEGAVKLFVASRNGGIVELVRHRPPAISARSPCWTAGSGRPRPRRWSAAPYWS